MTIKLTQNVGEEYHIPCSEVTFDTSGVTIHYRDYKSALVYISSFDAAIARERLKKLFPDKHVDTYETRFKLGEFLDMIQNIKHGI